MDDDFGVRTRVAGNPTTPTDTLRQLADTAGPDDRDIAAAVAANQSTPEELLIAFSYSEELELRNAAASNPATPAWRLRELSEPADINQFTWLGLIRNPNAPRDWVLDRGDQEYYQGVDDGPALRHPQQDPDLVLYAAGMETLLIQRRMLIDAFADTALDKHVLMTDVDTFFAWCRVVSKRRHGNN
ncbi:hypothetical protein [Microcella alkaliphila]|nr:hypothetical protein [Microcella alkaliphila]